MRDPSTKSGSGFRKIQATWRHNTLHPTGVLIAAEEPSFKELGNGGIQRLFSLLALSLKCLAPTLASGLLLYNQEVTTLGPGSR